MRAIKIVALGLVALVAASAIRVMAYDGMPPPSPMTSLILWAVIFFPLYRLLGLHKRSAPPKIE